MSSLLEKLKAGKRNVRAIKFPGMDQNVALRVLSNADVQDALFATENHFKQHKIEVSATTVEAYEDENTTQILFRALRDPQDYDRPFVKDVDELRRMLTRDEKDLLVEQYNAFEKEVSPSAVTLSDAEMDDLFGRLKKTPEIGNDLSFSTLKRLIVYLASRQQS